MASLKLMPSPNIPVVSCPVVNTAVAVLTAVDFSEVPAVARVSADADVPSVSVMVFLNVFGVPADSFG